MTEAVTIEQLDPRRRRDVAEVADLHMEFLPDSPVVRFGRRFARDFYYTRLVRRGLIGCTVARGRNGLVGFISYTHRPHDFMGAGMRAFLPSLAWILTTSVLARPAMVRDLLLVLRLSRERTGQGKRSGSRRRGEITSMAVRREATHLVPAGGTSRVSVRLFEHAVRRLEALDVREVEMNVDPANVPSNLFWNALGCSMEKIEVAGRPVHRYLYELTPARTER